MSTLPHIMEIPMNKIILAAALTLMCGSAFAQNTGAPAAAQSDMNKPMNNNMEKGSMDKDSMNNSSGSGMTTGSSTPSSRDPSTQGAGTAGSVGKKGDAASPGGTMKK
jgi:hypothetical protein